MIAAVTPGTRLSRPISRVPVTSLDVAIVGGVLIHGRTSRDCGSDLPCLPNHHIRSASLVEGSLIIHSEPLVRDMRRIVLRLGGFHAEMSFPECTGYVMGSSGLLELLELIYYDPKAVVHFLSGKATARAVRVNIFSDDAALNALMFTDVLNAHLSFQPGKSNSNNNNAEEATMPPDDVSNEVIDTSDLDEARVVNEKLMDGTVPSEYIYRSDVLNRTKVHLHNHVVSAKVSSRTALLHGDDRYPSQVH